MNRSTRSKYPVQKVIAIDVDGTLFIKGCLNSRLVAWIKEKKTEGFEIIIWSCRGTDYARMAADKAGLTETADVIVSKPGYLVDDKGRDWALYAHLIPFEGL